MSREDHDQQMSEVMHAQNRAFEDPDADQHRGPPSAAMSSNQDRTTERSAERRCPACGGPMVVTLSKPSLHYVNLAERTYGCECGHTDTMMVRTD
jgi:hypothetical protein